MLKHSLFLIILLCALCSYAQVSNAPLQNFISAGGAIGTSHPSTSVPTHFSSVGQPVVMARPQNTSNGAGVMNVNEIMFSAQKTWHVSTTGNDTNDGSSSAPLRNIQTALTNAAAGDIIKVAAGIYDEGLITQKKITAFGGYTSSFLDADRDIYANKTFVRAVSTTLLTDGYGCTFDGFIFNGNNTAETGLNISSSSTITHNIIMKCRQSPGQGINLSGNASIINNTIYDNITGVLIFGGTSSTAIFKNNIITGNSFGLNNSSASGIHTYNDINGNSFNYTGNFNSPGTGDISLDPLYTNISVNDFRLQASSPAINRGDPTDPVADEPAPNGGRIDMGTYGGTKNATSAVAEPSTQATSLSFSNISATSIAVNFTPGNGTSRILVCRQASAVNQNPVDGTTYTPNANFSSAPQIGTGNYVVGSGAGPITVTGLIAGTTYHFRVYEFNGSSGSENYLTDPATGNPGSSATISPAVWTVFTTSATTQWLQRVFFVEPTIGYAVGYAGTIIKSTDGGDTWTALTSGTTSILNGVHFTGTSTVYAVGLDGKILRTTNGGSSWTSQTSGTTNGLWDIYFTDANTGYVVGAGGLIRKTTDAGGTWTALSSGTSNALYDIHFVNANTAYVVGDQGTIRKTTNAGGSWITMASGTTKELLSVYFTDISNGYVVGKTGSVLKTTDAGTTWAETSWTTKDLKAVKFIDASTGYAVGFDGVMIKTTNAGASWSVEPSLTNDHLEDLFFTSPTHGIGVGWNGVIIKYQGSANPAGPTILDFNPKQGPVGTNITITGTNFSTSNANNIVKFNTLLATAVTNSTTTSLIATVPATATTGRITVEVSGQIATSSSDFNVTTSSTGPTINNFTPSKATVGTSVTISGTNFSLTPSDNVIRFNGTQASTPTAVSATSLTATVPAGATSGPITVTKGADIATNPTNFIVLPVITTDYKTRYDKGSSLTVGITVDNVAYVNEVRFKRRGISEPVSSESQTIITVVANKYEITLNAAALTDPIGLRYYFEVVDNANTVTPLEVKYAHVNYPATSTEQNIPGLSFGNKLSNYQIIAFPLDLKNKNVSAIFDELMPYDNTKWRLFRYVNPDYQEYNSFTSVVVGEGYWLIVRNNTDINPGEGTAVIENEAFTVNLKKGWNLIGNPYNFRISWDDVLDYNPGISNINTIKILRAGALISTEQIIEPYRGAFVFSDNDNTIPVRIPVTRNLDLGRVGKNREITNSLDQPHWEVNLKLFEDELSNQIGGIGMHPEAKLIGKDKFDEVSVPLPEGLGISELTYHHAEFPADFNKEVVPTQQEFTWKFKIRRSAYEGNLDLRWENNYFGNNDAELFLLDPHTWQIVNMRETVHFTISRETKTIRFLYGNATYIEKTLEGMLPFFANAYPNPASGEVTIPFRVPDVFEKVQVDIKISNSLGVDIATVVSGKFSKGSYEAKWKADVSSGMYFLKVQMGSDLSKVVKVMVSK